MEWARGQLIPLDTVEARNGFADMQPLKAVVGNARIVALGEATHGSREFFQLKHRMLEFLATEMGFNIFSIEANMPEAYRLNDYVLNGTGDAKALLKGMYFWTWNTEEVLDMIEWMREFNASGKGRLQFTGFDMQTPDVAMQNVRQFLDGAEPGYIPEVAYTYAEVDGRNSKSFGLASGSMPVAVAAGGRVRFTGYVKTERVQRGYAGLWFRVDGPAGVLTLDNMSTRGVRGTRDWTQCEIVADVPRGATAIYFGALHPGDGMAWFDSFTLEVDGTPYRDGYRLDLDFESPTPRGFYVGGTNYEVRLDSEAAHSGRQSLRSRYLGLSADVLYELSLSIADHMAAARDSYVAAGAGEWETDWAVQNARIVAQAMDQARGSDNRDPDMARNIGWILDHNPGGKVVVWAHNLHVAAGGVPDWVPMGSFLREKYGPDMAVFGFSFHRGSFQAIDMLNGGLKEFEAPPAPEGSLDAALAATGVPLFALDLRKVPEEPPASWFRDPHPMRNIGAGYADGYDAYYYSDLALPQAFDALLFVEKTTRARPVQP